MLCSLIQHHTDLNFNSYLYILQYAVKFNCVHKLMCVKEIKQPGSEGQIQMASVILEMRILRQKEHGSKQERRLGLCLAHSITMSGMWRFDQRKEGETVSGSPSSWIPWQEAMDYACAPPGKKTRLKMTISNTLTICSGRFLITLTIRCMRLHIAMLLLFIAAKVILDWTKRERLFS